MAERILRKDAERFLAKVPEPFAFWSHDGRVLHDMTELADALNNMTDETFAYHSNDYKKDFSNWVRDIIGDAKLAKDLDKSLNRTEAARVVVKRLALLMSKAAKKP